MAATDIDSTLNRLRALLGTGAFPTWPPRDFGAPVQPATNWTGTLSTTAHAASEKLDSRRQALSATHHAMGPLVAGANEVAETARRQVDMVINQWKADKEVLAPAANTTVGRAALLRAGALRVQEATAAVNAARFRFAGLAAEAQSLTATLPAAGPRTPDKTVQAVDFAGAPQRPPGGPFPEAPWEYNLDFTSDVEAGSFDYPGVRNAGQVTSIEDAWAELNRCFNCNFPMGGAPEDLPKVGDELPLEIRIAGQQLPMKFPVKVTQVEKTADEINIEFATLPGHVDGTDSMIHFRFYEQGGQLHLAVRGVISTGPGSGDVPIRSPLARTGYTQVAKTIWQPYIDRLTRHVAESKGLNTYGGG